jgi:hypothetical protein
VHFEVVDNASVPMPTADVESACDRRRLASAGLIAVLAAPTAFLAAVAALSRRGI